MANFTKHLVKRQWLIASVTLFLAACSNHQPAPVYDLYSKKSATQSRISGESGTDVYTVKPVDTLFSIAWYHSVDHQWLAKINKIKNNRIYPGQKLKLRKETSDSVFDPQQLIAALNKEVLQKPVKAPSTSKSSNSKTKLATSSNRKSARKPGRSTRVAKISKKSSSKPSYRTSSNKGYSRRNSRQRINWIWPADGDVIERFSSNSNANRGLDIAGRKGQPVRASAPGKVVYKGNGLRGYGNLVIIKHNNDYLSAYAHNDSVHVNENEFVKAGQRIADIGRSGAQRDKLHFEIRYKGKPVDPLNYLPQK